MGHHDFFVLCDVHSQCVYRQAENLPRFESEYSYSFSTNLQVIQNLIYILITAHWYTTHYDLQNR